jgi:hypothetical protein
LYRPASLSSDRATSTPGTCVTPKPRPAPTAFSRKLRLEERDNGHSASFDHRRTARAIADAEAATVAEGELRQHKTRMPVFGSLKIKLQQQVLRSPGCFSTPSKTVILSEAPRRSVALRTAYGAKSKDPGDIYWQMLFAAFQPQT